ncbi:MAG: GNAT family N-acetyltransferase [Acidimicrobiales bacterium]
MTRQPRIIAGPSGRRAYRDLRTEYHRTLVAPLDDMWASFADRAEPLAIQLDGEVVGCASIDDDRRLQHFFVRTELDGDGDDLASRCFRAVVDDRGVGAVMASTVDPGFLSIGLSHCDVEEPVALMYRHEVKSEGGLLPDLQPAGDADQGPAVEFMADGTGDADPWLEGYLAERIERGELLLHRVEGRIVGVGERRLDTRFPGFAHLGMVVGESHRGRGIGALILNTLVDLCDRESLTPLCSTEPGNSAARIVIHRAGFRSRHRVFRLIPRA